MPRHLDNRSSCVNTDKVRVKTQSFSKEICKKLWYARTKYSKIAYGVLLSLKASINNLGGPCENSGTNGKMVFLCEYRVNENTICFIHVILKWYAAQ